MIRHAALADLAGINSLLAEYKIPGVGEEYLSDLSLVSVVDREVTGFIWAGLMADQTLAYVDYFVVTPGESRKGLGKKLAKAMVSELAERGCKVVLASVLQDQYCFKSLKSCIDCGMRLDSRPQYQLVGKISEMVEVIENG